MELVLAGPGHPFRGGIAYFTHTLAHELERRHPGLSCWASFSRQYPSFLFPGESDRQEEGQLATLRPADLRWDPWSPASITTSMERCGGAGAKVLVFPWWTWVWAATDRWLIREARRCGIEQVVAVVHNAFDHEGAGWKRALARSALGQADAFLVHSSAIAEPIRDGWPGRPMAVAPLPVHPLPGDRRLPASVARQRLGLPAGGPVFLFFGLVRPYKGLDLLLDAWPAIRKETGGTLLVAGEFWPGQEAVRRRVAGLSSEGVVLRDRFVPDGEVVDCFRAADLVVLPYRSATGSGVVPIATWFGRPVLGTAIPGIVDVVREGENGLLVSPGDVEAIARRAVEGVEPAALARLVGRVEADGGDGSWQRYVAILLSLTSLEVSPAQR